MTKKVFGRICSPIIKPDPPIEEDTEVKVEKRGGALKKFVKLGWGSKVDKSGNRVVKSTFGKPVLNSTKSSDNKSRSKLSQSTLSFGVSSVEKRKASNKNPSPSVVKRLKQSLFSFGSKPLKDIKVSEDKNITSDSSSSQVLVSDKKVLTPLIPDIKAVQNNIVKKVVSDSGVKEVVSSSEFTKSFPVFLSDSDDDDEDVEEEDVSPNLYNLAMKCDILGSDNRKVVASLTSYISKHRSNCVSSKPLPLSPLFVKGAIGSGKTYCAKYVCRHLKLLYTPVHELSCPNFFRGGSNHEIDSYFMNVVRKRDGDPDRLIVIKNIDDMLSTKESKTVSWGGAMFAEKVLTLLIAYYMHRAPTSYHPVMIIMRNEQSSNHLRDCIVSDTYASKGKKKSGVRFMTRDYFYKRMPESKAPTINEKLNILRHCKRELINIFPDINLLDDYMLQKELRDVKTSGDFRAELNYLDLFIVDVDSDEKVDTFDHEDDAYILRNSVDIGRSHVEIDNPNSVGLFQTMNTLFVSPSKLDISSRIKSLKLSCTPEEFIDEQFWRTRESTTVSTKNGYLESLFHVNIPNFFPELKDSDQHVNPLEDIWPDNDNYDITNWTDDRCIDSVNPYVDYIRGLSMKVFRERLPRTKVNWCYTASDYVSSGLIRDVDKHPIGKSEFLDAAPLVYGMSRGENCHLVDEYLSTIVRPSSEEDGGLYTYQFANTLNNGIESVGDKVTSRLDISKSSVLASLENIKSLVGEDDDVVVSNTPVYRFYVFNDT